MVRSSPLARRRCSIAALQSSACLWHGHLGGDRQLILYVVRNSNFVSPTDNMMTPTTQNINAAKKKHFTKCVFVLPTFMSFADSRLTGARSRWASCSHRRRQHQKTRLAMRMPMSRSLLSTQRAIPRLKRSWIPTTTPSSRDAGFGVPGVDLRI